MKKPELLAPAGNMEKLEMAFLYGADAAYLAGKGFGMRAQGGNFSNEELLSAVSLAKRLDKKIYVTVNTMPHNEEIDLLPDYLGFLQSAGVDALIISDLGVWQLAREYAPDLPAHVSTQANTVNWASAVGWEKLGAARVVLARELTQAEIADIKRRVNIELEIFIHGAMCIAYSGRCLLSSYMAGRDANRGMCAQACRWRYNLLEEKRPGEYFPVFEDAQGTYVFNSRDLCLLEYLPQLITMGIDSFKIEGRMKSVHYVATAVSVYRQAIDAFCASPDTFQVKKKWWKELEKISHRPYTTGFIKANPYEEGQVYTESSYQQTHDFVGLVKGYAAGFLLIEQRNNIQCGGQLEILQPDGRVLILPMEKMFAEDGTPIDEAPHPRQLFRVPFTEFVPKNSLLRRERHD